MPFLVEDIAAAQVGVPFGIGCFNLAIVVGFLFFVHGSYLCLGLAMSAACCPWAYSFWGETATGGSK